MLVMMLAMMAMLTMVFSSRGAALQRTSYTTRALCDAEHHYLIASILSNSSSRRTLDSAGISWGPLVGMGMYAGSSTEKVGSASAPSGIPPVRANQFKTTGLHIGVVVSLGLMPPIEGPSDLSTSLGPGSIRLAARRND